jgi:GAF domain-containing protein/HAMP domain-containing protein
MLAGQPGFKTVTAGGRDLFVAYAPLKNTGWVLASVAEASTVLKAVGTLQTELRSATTNLIFARLLPVSLLIFAAVLILGYLLTNRFIKPVQNLAVYAQRVGSGEWDAPVPASSDDEVGQLSSALQQMASQLHELVTGLEAHVAQRTLDLEKRTTQLQVAAEVARDSTAVATTGVEGGVELLMDRAVNLIRDRFGFYHAGIFLLDELGEYAVLQAATGEAGRLLLEKRHRLKVGETGLVGYATGKSMPRISPDVTLDPKHYRNPYLPDTRAEMALPMRVGDQVIGALDVQSREIAAFDEDDITILQTLADQLAVAIENARLLQKLQSHVDELETLYSQYSQAAWHQLSKEEPVAGFIYDSTGIKPILRSQAGGNGHSPDLVEIPLKVRDEVIGYLQVLPEEKGLLPDDLDLLQAASGRISQAMESARLFEESQSRASREQIINQVANQVRSSIHMETILRNTVRELGKALGASRTFIQLGLASPQPGSDSPAVPKNGAANKAGDQSQDSKLNPVEGDNHP